MNGLERLSNIISLDFGKCALENSDPVPVFDCIKVLQTFNCEYACSEDFPTAPIDLQRDVRVGRLEPQQTVQSILARFSGSLINLDMMTTDTEVRHGSFNAGHVFVGDLRGFRVLENLGADALLFIESFLEDSIVKALNEKFETARQKKIRKGIHHFALSAKDHMKLIDRRSH